MNPRAPALALITLAAPLHARVWTTADNKTFEADYVSATATHVTVKVRGQPSQLFAPGRFSFASRNPSK